MTGIDKLMCRSAALVIVGALSMTPATAQVGGTEMDMMTQMAPMLEMMKAKMGKRRFAMLMQTMGPMMSNMMENGGGFGGGFGGMMGGSSFNTGGFGMGGSMGGFGGNEMIAMIPQIMSMVDMGGGRHRRHRRHR